MSCGSYHAGRAVTLATPAFIIQQFSKHGMRGLSGMPARTEALALDPEALNPKT